MRTRHWISIGIALSVAWILLAGINQRKDDIARAESYATFAHRVCTKTNGTANAQLCDVERDKGRDLFMQGSWGNVFAISLLPLPFAWLGAFIGYHTIRAQILGFSQVFQWRTRRAVAKGVILGCAFAALAAVAMGIITLMNLYVDTRVPVALPPFKPTVTVVGDQYAAFGGTWTRAGKHDESSLAFPLQHSEIVCHRDQARCVEGRGYVSTTGTPLLNAEVVEYEIENWNDSIIQFKNEDLCAIEEFTVDIRSETVSGAGRRLTRTGCDPAAAKSDERWTYQLSSGFPIYWELRKKARPAPLRIIQAFFGN